MHLSKKYVRDNLRTILADGPSGNAYMLKDIKEVFKWVKEDWGYSTLR